MFDVFFVIFCLFSNSKNGFARCYGPLALRLRIGPSAVVFEACDVTYGEERRCSTKSLLKVFQAEEPKLDVQVSSRENCTENAKDSIFLQFATLFIV